MRSMSKFTGILVALTFVLASCSPSVQLPMLNKENPKGEKIPKVESTQMVQSDSAGANTPENQQNMQPGRAEAVAALEGVYQGIYQNVNPSVVNIQVQQKVTASGMPTSTFSVSRLNPSRTRSNAGLARVSSGILMAISSPTTM